MKKKLLLINVIGLEDYDNIELFHPITNIKLYEPIHLGIIAALTPDDWEVEIIDENFEIFQFKSADLIGISSFSIGINRAYKIAGIYKEKN